MIEITDNEQRIVVYKINPNMQELDGEVAFDRNVDGRILYGRIFISNNVVSVKDEKGEVVGIFSLDHYYFLKSSS